jgi:hypothetical protein
MQWSGWHLRAQLDTWSAPHHSCCACHSSWEHIPSHLLLHSQALPSHLPLSRLVASYLSDHCPQHPGLLAVLCKYRVLRDPWCHMLTPLLEQLMALSISLKYVKIHMWHIWECQLLNVHACCRLSVPALLPPGCGILPLPWTCPLPQAWALFSHFFSLRWFILLQMWLLISGLSESGVSPSWTKFCSYFTQMLDCSDWSVLLSGTVSHIYCYLVFLD